MWLEQLGIEECGETSSTIKKSGVGVRRTGLEGL